MKRALIVAALASGIALLSSSSHARPVDGTPPTDGFGAMNARDSGITLDPLGDLGIDASAIARAWPGDGYGTRAGSDSDHKAFRPPADFEALLRDGNGHGSGTSGLERNPYFALGTWGGDGRAIVHQVIAADAGPHGGQAGDDYAVELAFHGFGVVGGRRNDSTDATAPFDGDPLFIPNSGFKLANGSGSPGTDSGNNGGGNNGGGGDPGITNNGGSNNGGGGNSGGGNGGSDDPGPTAGDPGPGGGLTGGAPCPVPEPSGLMLLLVPLMLVMRIRRRRALARIAVPAVLAAAALMVAPGAAKAQLHDWETLCNGTGGATPDVVIEGCSAVIGSDNEKPQRRRHRLQQPRQRRARARPFQCRQSRLRQRHHPGAERSVSLSQPLRDLRAARRLRPRPRRLQSRHCSSAEIRLGLSRPRFRLPGAWQFARRRRRFRARGQARPPSRGAAARAPGAIGGAARGALKPQGFAAYQSPIRTLQITTM